MHAPSPQEDQVALHLVCDYLKEGNLIDATKATYLISKEIESPMGAHLAAFASREDAQKIQGKKEENSTTGKVSKLSSKDISTLPLLTMTTCMITN